MYCSHCGKQVVPDSNFCSHCGAAIGRRQESFQQQARLTRPRHPRMIAGVCAGIALHFGWDLTLVRILTVVIALMTSGCGLLAYLGAWVLMPEAPYELTDGTSHQQGVAA
ncbi:PspC domain-containing protein [Granulicella sp. WH15]|uniref:PspC domain-containing protein n=1 Tax=Granulicella sp. WH15 TaxID=2602070 RepID=UPI001366BD53|nr:PspC domain-containing protein [Granulicella sp. WH15]QHN03706.1 PspC domain-containing protein [Granulicella sp. WH15]